MNWPDTTNWPGNPNSELLASRGSKVHLVDVASGLLVAAQERQVKAGLGGQILSVTNASATDLSFIADDSCGAVLMLGPFYSVFDCHGR